MQINYSNILFLFIFFQMQLGCISQKSEIAISMDQKDEELARIYTKFYENRHDYGATFGEARDTILIRFRNTLEKTLQYSKAVNYPFPLLAQKISIVQSEDKKLRIFSWDELNGGPWHIYNATCQYTNDNNVLVKNLSSEEENPKNTGEVTYYEIENLEDGTYLVTGYGTHGAGKEFFLTRLLTFTKSKVSDCSGCFDGKNQLFYEVPRGSKDKPIFNKTDSTITIPEYLENEETGFLHKTENRVVYHYKDGTFLKQE